MGKPETEKTDVIAELKRLGKKHVHVYV